jgi:hypothetical protein
LKKLLSIFSFFIVCGISAQINLPFDSVHIKGTTDFFADDYGNIFLYKNKEFSLTKYDSLGIKHGQLRLTLPFKIQSVQNPFTIPSFSENAQEIKFFDRNLNEIQTFNLRQKFGYIRKAYVEDYLQVWLLDESSRRLLQYNLREDQIVNSFPFNVEIENLIDFLIEEKTGYFLYENELKIIHLLTQEIEILPLQSARKIRRENKNIFIFTNENVQLLENGALKKIFEQKNSQFVDKNSGAYFVIKENNLYLYPIKKVLN